MNITAAKRREVLWLLKSVSNNSEWTRSYPEYPAMRQSANMLLTHQGAKWGTTDMKRVRNKAVCAGKGKTGASGSPTPGQDPAQKVRAKVYVTTCLLFPFSNFCKHSPAKNL